MTVENFDYITVHEIRRCGYCVSGMREWCRLNNYSFRDLVSKGYPVALAETSDDAVVQHVLRVKRGNQNG